MLTIDGSRGEGGGQILRSALALAIVTARPVRIENIRAGRKKPGLLRQHLTAVQAAARVCSAHVEGAELGSGAVTFTPGPVAPGVHHFAIGSAGSTTLVLQTILLPLLTASGPSRITLEGGTHNPAAPPFDFLDAAYLRLLNRMGPRVTAHLERPGFFPAGGGRMVIEIEPCAALGALDLLERGELRSRRACVWLSHLPRHVAEREIRVIERRLAWSVADCEIREAPHAVGPGNLVALRLEFENVTEVFCGFGSAGRPAEAVAGEAVDACRRYLPSTAPLGEYLTDQWLLPLALAGRGSFRSTGLSPHATTHLELIHDFLPVRLETGREESGVVRVSVR
ncbi:MAG: RNA 3'-terminal phosphate cyclase [Phycisphaerales bacterium]|nr:RNA 3'-terminal phosphate cyclase [Phycisphaerales bacterium]